MAPSETLKVSFSFYPGDVQALHGLVADCREAGLRVYRATVLRALIHAASEKGMIAYGTALANAQAEQAGPREADNVADHPTIDLLTSDLKKLDDAVTALTRAGHSANRAFVVRALVRLMPPDVKLVSLVKKFVKEFPDKPRGWAARKEEGSRD